MSGLHAISHGPPTLFASTIGGLPDGPADGQMAVLRLAATAFHFVPLVFSASLAKWVSAEYHGFTSSAANPGTTTTSTSAANLTNAEVHRGVIPYPKECYDAGLRLQVWLACFVSNSGANTTTFQIRVREITDGETSSVDIWQGPETSHVGTTATQKVQLWADVTHTTAPTDANGFGFLELWGRVTAGTGNYSFASCKYRWVAAAA